MIFGSISYGAIILFVASTTSHKVIVIRKNTLIRVPIISARCIPKVYFIVAGLRVILSAVMENANPIISDARCAVSVKIAIEFAIIPPVSYAAMKKTETKATHLNFAIDAL